MVLLGVREAVNKLKMKPAG
jgi:hypothetical protein